MLLYCGLKLKRNIIPNPKYTVGVSEKDNQRSATSQPESEKITVDILYLKPMIGNDLLEKSEYDVEIVKWIDGSTDNKIDKVYPLTLQDRDQSWKR
jgi:hypothetical protein